MGKELEIRQAKTEFSSALGLDKAYATSDDGRREEFGVLGTMKGSLNWFHIRRSPDGRWATGIDEHSSRFNYIDDPKKAEEARAKAKSERERFERLLGKDLSGTSEFWDSYTIPLVNKRGAVIFKMEYPQDELMVKVAVASGLVAPSFDALSLDEYYDNKCRFYIYNASDVASKKTQNTLKRSEAEGLLFVIRDSKDRLYHIAKTLNLTVSNQMDAQGIYVMLLEHVKNLPIARIDSVIEVFKKEPKDLQVNVKVREAQAKGIFEYNKDMKGYVFMGQKVGVDYTQIVHFFSKKENLNLFEALEGAIEGAL